MIPIFQIGLFNMKYYCLQNNKYKVVKIERKEMKNGRSFTTILLEQTELKKEIKLKELIDTSESDILKQHLQYPNRLSLLYKKEEK